MSGKKDSTKKANQIRPARKSNAKTFLATPTEIRTNVKNLLIRSSRPIPMYEIIKIFRPVADSETFYRSVKRHLSHMNELNLNNYQEYLMVCLDENGKSLHKRIDDDPEIDPVPQFRVTQISLETTYIVLSARRTPIDDVSRYELEVLLANIYLHAFAQGTIFEDLNDLVTEKYEQALTDVNAKAATHNISKKFFSHSIGQRSYKHTTANLDVIYDGLLRQKKLSVSYQKSEAKEPKSYTLIPLSLLNYQSRLYLVGQVESNNGTLHAPTTFAIERFVAVKAKKVDNNVIYFDYPEDFHARTEFKDRFGIFSGSQNTFLVRLRFKKDLYRYLRELTFGKNQELTAEADFCLLSFEAQHPLELVKWIVGFSNDCQVLSPEFLIDEVKGHLNRALEIYSSQIKIAAS